MNPKPKIFLLIYVIGLLLSLFVIIPMSISINQLGGYCLLYATGNFILNNNSNVSTYSYKLLQWGSSSNCNYLLYMGIMVLVASAVLIWTTGMLVWKDHDRAPFGSFIVMIGNGVVMFCLFVAALISTIGYEQFCEGLFKASPTSSCDSVDLKNVADEYQIDTSQFFSNYRVVQFGIWCSFCTWLIGSILAFFKVYYYHKNDDLLQSLAYEKETLLNRRRQYQPIHSDNPASYSTA